MKLVGLIARLVVLLALLLPGCGQVAEQARAGTSSQPTAGAASGGAVKRVTILYTGYGRGAVDPLETCT